MLTKFCVLCTCSLVGFGGNLSLSLCMYKIPTLCRQRQHGPLMFLNFYPILKEFFIVITVRTSNLTVNHLIKKFLVVMEPKNLNCQHQHTIPQLDYILSKLNVFHTFTTCLFQVNFNIILPSATVTLSSLFT